MLIMTPDQFSGGAITQSSDQSGESGTGLGVGAIARNAGALGGRPSTVSEIPVFREPGCDR